MVTQALNINTDHGPQTWPAAAARAWMSPWPTVAVQAFQVSMGPASTWSPNSNMAPGGRPDPRQSHGPPWQQKPWTPTQTLAVARSRTQLQLLGTSLSPTSVWPLVEVQVTRQVTRIFMALGSNLIVGHHHGLRCQSRSQTPTLPLVVTGHQLPFLRWDHGPRHGPQPQLKSRHLHGSGW